MPRGDKSRYTDKQERKADHIAEGYEERGVSEKEAERRAWAAVYQDAGGGNKPGGSGRGKSTGNPAAHKAGARAGPPRPRGPSQPICGSQERLRDAQAQGVLKSRQCGYGVSSFDASSGGLSKM